jgi:hypothetical protein
MTRIPEFDDYLTDWLEDGPTDAPGRLLDTVLAAFPAIPQRPVAERVPWRFPPINGYARALVGIAAVAAIALGGFIFLNGPSSNQVGGLSLATPSPSPSPLPSSIDTSSWTPFTSARHGVAVRYPTDWTATGATAPWPAGTHLYDRAGQPGPMLDTFTSPIGPTFAIASQPLPIGVTGAAWLAAHEASGAASDPPTCWPAPADMERTTVDGLPAWIRTGCGLTEAIVFAGGRAYDLLAFVDPTLNRPVFNAFLSTVTFSPATADDTPAEPMSPSPTPS